MEELARRLTILSGFDPDQPVTIGMGKNVRRVIRWELSVPLAETFLDKARKQAKGEGGMMDIGQAIGAIKDGKRVARQGWNGVGMWVAYSPGHDALPASAFWSPANRDYADTRLGKCVAVRASMTLKTADGSIAMGWSPSGSDTLATDWYVVE